jgi:hypothetical protein
LTQLVHRRGGADQVEFAAGAQFQLGVFAPQQRRLYRAGDDQQQPVGLERLFDEVIGPDLDRLDRGLDGADGISARSRRRIPIPSSSLPCSQISRMTNVGWRAWIAAIASVLLPASRVA